MLVMTAADVCEDVRLGGGARGDSTGACRWWEETQQGIRSKKWILCGELEIGDCRLPSEPSLGRDFGSGGLPFSLLLLIVLQCIVLL